MDYQIRLRTDELFSTIMVIQDWLGQAAAGFAFQHNKPGNNHYHIYFFGIDKQADSIRKTLGKYYKKTEYSVKTTAGKSKDKIVPMLAWQYGTEDKLLEPVWVKGFDEESTLAFKLNAQEYYASLKPMTAIQITQHDHYIVRPDRVWEKLKDNQMKYKDKDIRQIKSMIAAEWINAGKAMPRPSDLHRYATSLYYLNKYEGEVPEEAMIGEFN